jgi:hypothetical protein
VAGRDQGVSGKHCYHCKQWIEEGQAHDCWTTTEAALTRDLAEDLREAYQRIRETAAAFGDQRIYASLNSIMFSRKACYLFVRPKKTYLEVCVFLGRPLKSPQVRRAEPASKTKFANLLRIQHRDEVEAPITDWMQEAYERSDELSATGRRTAGKKTATGTTKKKRRVSSRSASSARNRRR